MSLSNDQQHEIELALGRPLTETEVQQAERWWLAAERLIATHAQLDDLETNTLGYVLSEAVAARVRVAHRVGEKRLDVQVDDARVSREWHTNPNDVTILPEWWAMLGIRIESGVGSTQTYGEPDTVPLWWSL